MAVQTPEIHPSLVAVVAGYLLSASEPVQFADGKSACDERFIAAVTHVSDVDASREYLAVTCIAQTHCRIEKMPCP